MKIQVAERRPFFILKPLEISVSQTYFRQCARSLQDQKTEFLAHSGIKACGSAVRSGRLEGVFPPSLFWACFFYPSRYNYYPY
ncbi:MAG: hypothetical protein FWG74_04875, partial [Planctomycetes bacterium]|nr:hypothetical protein [Planctomycetota bacterium]